MDVRKDENIKTNRIPPITEETGIQRFIMKCSERNCTIDLNYLISTMDDGTHKVALCQNHQLLAILGELNSAKVELTPSDNPHLENCQICGEVGILYKEYDSTFHLCQLHLIQLLSKNLEPESFKFLYSIEGNIFLLHDDFYDDSTGTALQPLTYFDAHKCEAIFKHTHPLFLNTSPKSSISKQSE